MISLKTQTLKEACKIIGKAAAEGSVANLELKVENGILQLNVADRDYYVRRSYNLEMATDSFRAVIKAKLFLDLISNVSTEDIYLDIKGNAVVLSADNSNYKLPLIFENDKLLELPVIGLQNKTCDMKIERDILWSIYDVNSKELQKLRGDKSFKPIQEYYFITENGAFTFTSGACFNKFKLEKPINLLLSQKIVKLFKLFDGDVQFSYGHDMLSNGQMQTKAVFETADTYIAAVVLSDDTMLRQMKTAYSAAEGFVQDAFPRAVVVSCNSIISALSRLEIYNNNKSDGTLKNVDIKVSATSTGLIFTDKDENIESIAIENTAGDASANYVFSIMLNELMLALTSYRDEPTVTINFGNAKCITISHKQGTIINLIPECV